LIKWVRNKLYIPTTQFDIKVFQSYNKIMLTKGDKKFILDTITFAITQNNKIIGKRFDVIDRKFDLIDKKFGEVNEKISNLTTDVVDLFESTNSAMMKSEERLSDKIDKVNKNLSEKINDTNERIDKISEHLSDDFES